jgi:hypothetical protein
MFIDWQRFDTNCTPVTDVQYISPAAQNPAFIMIQKLDVNKVVAIRPGIIIFPLGGAIND